MALIDFVLLFIFFILGTSIGSFLNVLIDRLPKGQSIIKDRSHCDHCKKKIRDYDLIPIVSYFILSGHCRFCKKKLSIYYPLVEFLSGLNFTLIFLIFTPHLQNLFQAIYFTSLLVITSLLITIFFTDLKYMIIPDSILICLLIFSIPKLIFSPFPINYLTQILTALISFFLFYLICFLTKGKGLGGGDVKLAFLIGLLNSPYLAISSFYIAFLTGATIGVILIFTGNKKFGQKIPFGPFLVLGCYLSILLKPQLEAMIKSVFNF